VIDLDSFVFGLICGSIAMVPVGLSNCIVIPRTPQLPHVARQINGEFQFAYGIILDSFNVTLLIHPAPFLLVNPRHDARGFFSFSFAM